MSMNRRTFLSTAAGALAALAAAPASGQEALDLQTFLPTDHFPALPGSLTMLVGTTRRDGAERYYQFSADGSSWREGYIPVTDGNSLHKMEFLVGPEGEKVVYPLVLWATERTATGWPFPPPYALAELEINGGRGAPAGQKKFVITRARVVSATPELPIQPSKVIDDLHRVHRTWWEKEMSAEIEKGLDKSREIVDRKKGGGRSIDQIFQATWLTGPKRLRFRILTEITDGAEFRPETGGFRWGITLGQQFDVDHTGKPVDTKVLPIAPFKKELAPAPKEPERRFPRDPLPPK